MSSITSIILILASGVVRVPASRSAGEVVAKIQAFYKKTERLSADFRQEYTNADFGKSSVSDGRLYVSRPDKMRWDYAKPKKKYFISDGKLLWVYEVNEKQVFKTRIEDNLLPVAVTFLHGKGDLSAEFEASFDMGSKFAKPGAYVLTLIPKAPSAQYKSLMLVVSDTDYHVEESVIIEPNKNENRFRFINVSMNDKAKVENKHFRFVPPEGVKVVEMGSGESGE